MSPKIDDDLNFCKIRNSKMHESYYEYLRTDHPFTFNHKLSFWRKIQILFMSVLVVPLKFFFGMLFFSLTWFYAFVVSIGIKPNSKHPVGRFRQILINPLRLLLRLFYFFIGFYWVKVVGKRASSKEAPILVVCSHSTIFDGILFSLNSPFPSAVSRIENLNAPFAGAISKAAQLIFVKREQKSSRKATIEAINNRARSREWPQLIIFPEGVITNRSSIVEFKNGPFIPGMPVQPVAIEFLNSWNTVSWVGENSKKLKQLFWYSLCQFRLIMKVTYMDVYYPNEEEQNNPKIYASNVRDMFSSFLNIPCSNISNEDNKLMKEAKKHGLPYLSGSIGFSELNQTYGLTFEKSLDLISKFADISKPTGVINYEMFLSYFKFPNCESAKKVFSMYDYDQKKLIDSIKFFIGRIKYFMVDVEKCKNIFHLMVNKISQKFDIDQLSFILSQSKDIHLSKKDVTLLYDKLTTNSLQEVTYDQFELVVLNDPEYLDFFGNLIKN